jgi:hypothetical protein
VEVTADDYGIPELTLRRIAEQEGVVLGRSSLAGETLSAHFDVEFPTVFQAVRFKAHHSPHADFRDPAVSLYRSVVLSVHIPAVSE